MYCKGCGRHKKSWVGGSIAMPNEAQRTLTGWCLDCLWDQLYSVGAKYDEVTGVEIGANHLCAQCDRKIKGDDYLCHDCRT